MSLTSSKIELSYSEMFDAVVCCRTADSQLIRAYQNFFLSQPYRISDYHARYMMSERQWSIIDKLPELKSMSMVKCAYT